MKTIYGTILNNDAIEVSEAKIELYGKDKLISDIFAGKETTPLKTTISGRDGKYKIEVGDDFEGYVVVPAQTIKNCKVQFNYAIVNILSIGLNYNVIVKTTIYDVHDLDLSGEIDLHELAVWVRDIEENRLKIMEYRLSQLESKLRMLVEIIIPLILKK